MYRRERETPLPTIRPHLRCLLYVSMDTFADTFVLTPYLIKRNSNASPTRAAAPSRQASRSVVAHAATRRPCTSSAR